jgi:ParE toxin of type II toxin-antitoxin system, parDE
MIPGRPKMLTGSHGLWRIRIGDYRVVYTVDDQQRLVRVAAAGHAATSTPVDRDMPVPRWRLMTWPQATAGNRMPAGAVIAPEKGARPVGQPC